MGEKPPLPGARTIQGVEERQKAGPSPLPGEIGEYIGELESG